MTTRTQFQRAILRGDAVLGTDFGDVEWPSGVGVLVGRERGDDIAGRVSKWDLFLFFLAIDTRCASPRSFALDYLLAASQRWPIAGPTPNAISPRHSTWPRPQRLPSPSSPSSTRHSTPPLALPPPPLSPPSQTSSTPAKNIQQPLVAFSEPPTPPHSPPPTPGLSQFLFSDTERNTWTSENNKMIRELFQCIEQSNCEKNQKDGASSGIFRKTVSVSRSD